jgi:hypothetical protein
MASGNSAAEAAEAWATTLINEAEKIAQATLEFVIEDNEKKSLTSMLVSCYFELEGSLKFWKQSKKDLPTMEHGSPAYTGALLEANQAHNDIMTTFQSKLEDWKNAQNAQIELMYDNDAFDFEQASAKIRYLEECVIWLQKALDQTIDPINTDGGAEAVAGPAAVVAAGDSGDQVQSLLSDSGATTGADAAVVAAETAAGPAAVVAAGEHPAVIEAVHDPVHTHVPDNSGDPVPSLLSDSGATAGADAAVVAAATAARAALVATAGTDAVKIEKVLAAAGAGLTQAEQIAAVVAAGVDAAKISAVFAAAGAAAAWSALAAAGRAGLTEAATIAAAAGAAAAAAAALGADDVAIAAAAAEAAAGAITADLTWVAAAKAGATAGGAAARANGADSQKITTAAAAAAAAALLAAASGADDVAIAAAAAAAGAAAETGADPMTALAAGAKAAALLKPSLPTRENPERNGELKYYLCPLHEAWATVSTLDKATKKLILRLFDLPNNLDNMKIEVTDAQLARYQVIPVTLKADMTFTLWKVSDTECDVYYCGVYKPGPKKDKDIQTLYSPPRFARTQFKPNTDGPPLQTLASGFTRTTSFAPH